MKSNLKLSQEPLVKLTYFSHISKMSKLLQSSPDSKRIWKRLFINKLNKVQTDLNNWIQIRIEITRKYSYYLLLKKIVEFQCCKSVTVCMYFFKYLSQYIPPNYVS